MRKLSYILNIDALRIVYFAHFQSLTNYDIIFGGSSTNVHNVFFIQKRIIRVMLGLAPRRSCRDGFKKLDILAVPSLYIFSLIMFVVINPDHFKSNSSFQGIDTRQKSTTFTISEIFFSAKVCYLILNKNI